MRGDTIEPYDALRRLGEFMYEHEEHGGKVSIDGDVITLYCDAHSSRIDETLTMENMALRRAMGQEIYEAGAVMF